MKCVAQFAVEIRTPLGTWREGSLIACRQDADLAVASLRASNIESRVRCVYRPLAQQQRRADEERSA